MSEIKLIHGDCMDYLPYMKENEFDLAIVDPPYGIGICSQGTLGGARPFGSKKKRYTVGRKRFVL
jgi:DNA modification methylase